MASTRQAALFLAAFAALATAPDAAPIAPSNDTCIDDELFEPPAFSDLTSPAESTAESTPSSVTLNFSAAADGPNATLDAAPSSVEEHEAAAPDAAESEAPEGAAAADNASSAEGDGAAPAEPEGEAANASEPAAGEPPPPPSDVDWDGDEVMDLEQFKEKALLRIQTDQAIAPSDLVAGQAAGAAGAAGQAAGGLPSGYKRPTKPLKDRFNYLAADLGAKVLAKNDELQASSLVLNEDRDRYMLMEREVKKKWFTISLVEDILLDTLVLGNFEHYSVRLRPIPFPHPPARRAPPPRRPAPSLLTAPSPLLRRRRRCASSRSWARARTRAASGCSSESSRRRTRGRSRSSKSSGRCGCAISRSASSRTTARSTTGRSR